MVLKYAKQEVDPMKHEEGELSQADLMGWKKIRRTVNLSQCYPSGSVVWLCMLVSEKKLL